MVFPQNQPRRPIRAAFGLTIAAARKLSEAALGLELAWAVPESRLKGTVITLHFTDYNNRGGAADGYPYRNAFQDERDVKFSLVIPLTK
ncbi:MAG: hypothetical protein LBV21_06115 [Candidatus Adiutrix sp.]|nr:hypothetical protein [Candidatus Adiutrix sp.]